MIRKFQDETALLLVDVQKGVNDTLYYGGAKGGRKNPLAESNILKVLDKWRTSNLSLESGGQIEGMKPQERDIVVVKDVNSGFIGTSLELDLRRAGIQRLLVLGFFTNVCIETTVRMSGNMGFDTYLVHDACAAMNSIGHDGKDYDPELVHNMAIGNLHGEFCTAISVNDALHLCEQDAEYLDRVQGNE